MTVYNNPNERLDLEHYSDIPMFNMKAVVRHTRVPAPTLRAWERRYALLSPVRGENDYRLYSEREIVLIRWLKQRVDKGMSISHAVSLFRYLYVEKNRSGAQTTQRASNADTPTMRIRLDTPVLDEYADLQLTSEAIEQTDPLQLSPVSSDTAPLHTDV